MRITLIGSYPLSTLPLNEHTASMAKAFGKIQRVTTTVLADVKEQTTQDIPTQGFELIRCWRYNDVGSLLTLYKHIKESKPDVIWFNLVFSSFSDKPVGAFASILFVYFLKTICRFRVVVTLHAAVEFIDFSITKHRRFSTVKLLFAKLAQTLLFRVDVVYLYLNKYVQYLRTAYRRDNIYRSHHGIEDGDLAAIGTCTQPNVLIFGRFGGYKNLDFAIKCISALAAKKSPIHFTIAGSDHPSYPGHFADIQCKFKHLPNVSYKGYVPEEGLQDLFVSHSVNWLPYESNTGISGVAHLACRYGIALLLPDLAEFKDMVAEEGFAAHFHETGHVEKAVEALQVVLSDHKYRQKMAEANVALAKRTQFSGVLTEHVEFLRKKFNIAA